MERQRKRRIKSIFALSLTLMLLVLQACAPPDPVPRLRLFVEKPDWAVGQEMTVDVLVENAPTIYGADVRLVFDPSLLEVVDADEGANGVQLEPGDFIDPAQSFTLQHQADNEIGTIDYALTLLNPAPPVQGKGLLVQITFRAKASGRTRILIAEGLFGTQTGETIAPVLDSARIRVKAKNGDAGMDQDSLTRGLFAFLGRTDGGHGGY